MDAGCWPWMGSYALSCGAISENNSRVEVIVGGWGINMSSGRSMVSGGDNQSLPLCSRHPEPALRRHGVPSRVRLPSMLRLVQAALGAATKARPRSLHRQAM